MAKKNKRTIVEFLQYYLAGSAFFWSAYGSFILMFTVLDINYAVAKIISALLGNVINFILEKYWVFGQHNRRRNLDVEMFRYVSFQIINFLIDYLLVYYLWVTFDIRPEFGTFISAAFFLFWSYIGFKYWVFRPQRAAKGVDGGSGKAA